jgi:heparan-sulfate lyase
MKTTPALYLLSCVVIPFATMAQDPYTDREYAAQIVQEVLDGFNEEWNSAGSSRTKTVSFYLTDGSGADRAVNFSSKEGGKGAELLLLEPLNRRIATEDVQLLSFAPVGVNTDLMDVNTEPTGATRSVFIKFDVSDLEHNVTSAVVRLFAQDAASATIPVSVYAINDDSWTETTLTWNNKPASGDLLTTVNVSGAGKWYEFDVTAFVAGEATGDGMVTLQLIDDSAAGEVVRFRSATNAGEPTGGNMPEMLIVTDAPPADPVVVKVSKDAFLRDGDFADDNNNGSLVEVRGSGTEGESRQGILQFDLTDIEVLERAILRVHVESLDGETPITLSNVSGDGSWAESTVTWNNAPSVSSLVADATATTADEWLEFEIGNVDSYSYQSSDYVPFGVENVISVLNLDYPGLEEVKAAVEVRDWAAAEEAIFTYFKNRDHSHLPNPGRSRTKAEDALIHVFPGHANSDTSFMGAEIDWYGKALRPDGSIETDNEWYFFFHRWKWWQGLAAEYTFTGDEAYFEEWRYELVDYARTTTPLSSETWTVRRGMETAFRCYEMAAVLEDFLNSDQFDSTLMMFYLSSFHHHAEHIRTVYASSGNHLLHELQHVFMNSIFFPEFKLSGEWFDESVTRGTERIFIDVYPDGMNKEQIFHNQSGVYLQNFTSFYNLLNDYRHLEALPDGYEEQLIRMADVLLDSIYPDFKVSQVGDSWQMKENNYYTGAYPFIHHVADYGPDYPWLEFMQTEGNSGTPPDYFCKAYPISGFYFFRSAWNRQAVYMPIKATAGGAWHTQIDNGTFDIYAYGRHFMSDSGAFIYNSANPEDQLLRELFRSSKMHQTVTLDYENVIMDPNFIFWQDSEKLTVLVFENGSYPELDHERTVLFIDNKYFLVYDRAIGVAEGEVRAHFYLSPMENVMDMLDFTVETQNGAGANLLVKGFQQDYSMTMAQEEGWVSYQLGSREERPAWSYKVDKLASDSEVSFLTALLPYPKPEDAFQAVDATVNSDGDVLIFTLTVDGTDYEVHVNQVEGSTKLFTTSPAQDTEEYSGVLESVVARSGDWMHVDWMGWFAEANDRLIYSDLVAAWLYLHPIDPRRGEFWMWDYNNSEWVYTLQTIYPWAYSPDSGWIVMGD